MAKTLVALFDSFGDAQSAVQDLVNNGIRRDEISLIATEESGETTKGSELGHEPASAAAGGAGLGAALGGLAGLLIGLGALAIPGIGPVVAAGPLAAALAGAGIGAVTGGLVGALVDSGVPEEEARYYAEGVRRGGTLVSVRASDDMVQQATDILHRYHPADMHQRATQWQEAGWTGPAHEDYVASSQTGDFANYEPEFRRNYQTAYANMGYSYDQYRPAYRYGYDLAFNDRFGGWDWDRVEPEARRDWEQRYPNETWAEYRNAVQYGWEKARREASSASDMSMDHNAAGYAGDSMANARPSSTGRGETGQSADMDLARARYGDANVTPDSRDDPNAATWQMSGGTEKRDFEYYQSTDLGQAEVGQMRAGDADMDVQMDSMHDEHNRGQGDWGAEDATIDRTADMNLGHSGSDFRGPNDLGSNPAAGTEERSRYASSGFDRDQGSTMHETSAESADAGYAPAERSKPVFTGTDIGQTGSQYRSPESLTGKDWARSDRSPDDPDYDYETDYRGHDDSDFGVRAAANNEYQPGYIFGSKLASDERFRDRSWDEVEPMARRDWEQDNPGSAWDDVKESVRHGWYKITGRE